MGLSGAFSDFFLPFSLHLYPFFLFLTLPNKTKKIQANSKSSIPKRKEFLTKNSRTFSEPSVDDESEAHYLCAIINSKPVRDFIKSFSSAGRGFGTPSVMSHIGIPKFDSKNPLHKKLAEISKKCHQLKIEGKEKEIEKLEKMNDDLVKKSFGIK